MPELPIDIGFYESPTLPLAAQNCINHYPTNPQTKGAISTGALFSTPGLKLIATLPTGPGRGYNVFNEVLYIVSGDRLYRVSSSGIYADLGEIAGTEKVITSNNGINICIQVPGGSGYFYNPSSGLTEITDPDYQLQQAKAGGVTSVTYKNGYYVFTSFDEFFISSNVAIDGGISFDGLDFSTAEVKPDNNVLCMTVKNELYVAGVKTIELFQISATATFPFQRINGATIDKGVAARHSFIEFDNSFVFVGSGPNESIAIWRGASGRATKISTAAIDHAIQQYTADQIADVFAWTYTEDGNFFVGFGFPDTTFVYDATTSTLQGRPVWHERQSNGDKWRVNNTMDVYSNIYVLDSIDGRVGLLNREITTEYTEDITRTFTGSYLYNEGLSFKISEMELRTESGVTTQTGTESTIEALISIDGGRNFISLGSKGLGAYQEYNKRQIWKRLGRSERDAILRFITTGSTILNYTNLNVKIVGGR